MYYSILIKSKGVWSLDCGSYNRAFISKLKKLEETMRKGTGDKVKLIHTDNDNPVFLEHVLEVHNGLGM